MLSVCLLLNLNACEIEAQNLKLKKNHPQQKTKTNPKKICVLVLLIET